MKFFSDDDDDYNDYLNEGSMFGKMSKDEWEKKQRKAEEIVSGESSGMFERDKDIWKRIRKIKDSKY